MTNRQGLIGILCIALSLSTFAGSAIAALNVTDTEVVDRKRVGRIHFEYELLLTVTNTGPFQREVSARLTNNNPRVLQVLEGDLTFGSIAAGQSAVSQQPLKIRLDRRSPFDLNDMDITFSTVSPHYLTEGCPSCTNLDPEDEPEFGEPGYFDTYYGRLDPAGNKTTLHGWKTANSIDAFIPKNAKYVNAFDLGFGRDMTCSDATSRLACVVDNYILERDIHGNVISEKFAASVAMERSNRGHNDASITEFYVYVPADGVPTPVRPSDTELVRSNSITLDSEGPKSVPQSCFACHKGYIAPSGKQIGGVFLPWDLDVLGDWTGQPRVADQLENLRELNLLVHRDAKFLSRKPSIEQLIEGWYNGPPNAGTFYSANRLPNLTFWGAAPTALTLNEERFLYREVYAPYCRGCHAAQGPNVDTNTWSDGYDWTEASLFHDQAYYQLCDRSIAGHMPNAELTDAKFNADVHGYPSGGSGTAKNWLCDVAPKPREYVNQSSASAADGEDLFSSEGCEDCHTVNSFGKFSADFSTAIGPDLTCNGARIFTNLGKVNSEMAGRTLSSAEVADLRAYVDSQARCVNRYAP